jgi:hypothetical protein
VQRIFAEYHQIHGAEIAARLADHGDDALGLPRQIGLGHDHRQLQLNQPDHDALGRFVKAAKSVHSHLLIRSRGRGRSAKAPAGNKADFG